MSLNVTNTYGTIWDVVVEEKVVKANLSTARKDAREESGYRHMSWHTIFVGDAYEKAKELQAKDQIFVKSARIENSYNKETQKLYNTLVVFDFDFNNPEPQASTEE